METEISSKERLRWAGFALLGMLGSFTLWGVLIFLSPACLTKALEGLKSSKVILFSLLWGAVFAALFHLWALTSGPTFWVTLIVVRGLPWLAFGLGLALLQKWLPQAHPLDPLKTGLPLAGVAYCQLLSGSGFDWESPIAALANWPVCLALLPWLGLSGAAFLIGFCSHCLLSTQKLRVFLGLGLLTALGSVSLGLYYKTPPARPMPSLKIALIQTGWTEAQKWDPRYVGVCQDRLFELSLKAKGYDLIIWPETAWPRYSLWAQEKDTANVTRLARMVKGTLLVSSVEIRGEIWLNAVRKIEANGIPGQEYFKQRLIPFGEYIPLPDGLKKYFMRIKVREPEDRLLLAGSESVIYETKGLKYSPLVCYDSVIPSITAGVADALDFLVIMTNDAPLYWEFPKEAHFRSAILRSAQFQLPVFQASNNGVSGIIDAKGRVLSRGTPGDTGPQILRYGE